MKRNTISQKCLLAKLFPAKRKMPYLWWRQGGDSVCKRPQNCPKSALLPGASLSHVSPQGTRVCIGELRKSIA